MSGFLDDAYGATDARRERNVKRIVLGTLGAIVLAVLLYFWFRDYREEHQVRTFLSALSKSDYKSAYALWGCTDATPCRDYQYDKFLEDWGASSPHANASQARVTYTIGCDAGLLAELQFPEQKPVLLWVERNNDVLGFFPWKLRPVPDDAKSKMALWMWKLTRNCKPLIE